MDISNQRLWHRTEEYTDISARILVVSVVLVLVGAGFGVAVGSPPDQCSSSTTQTPITSCTTITTPGTYVLTTNITNSSETQCLPISSSDVVLDGRGHTIDGIADVSVDKPTIGVLVSDAPSSLENVTVRNLAVSDWNEDGIRFNHVTDAQIDNVTATNNFGNGINITASNGFVVTRINASGNSDGISL